MSKRILLSASVLSLLLASCARVNTRAAVTAPPSVAANRDAGRPADTDAPDLHEDNPFEAADYFRQQRVPDDDALPIERYQTALRHAAAMPRYSLAQGRFVDVAPRSSPTFGTWESLGPVNIGGRTRGFAIHPQNPNIMWAGGATGGLWKTVNGGQTWTPIDDFAPVLAINCLVMDPHDPNTLYACTGEQTQNWRGAGIYKTSDGGASWSQLPATATPDFYFVNNIAVSPAAPSHLYAATNTGLWASMDGGATWNLSLASPDGGPAATRTGGTTNGCFDTIVEPGQATDTVFAVCHPPGSLPYAVFRNADAAGAGSWSVVLSDANMWYTVLAAAPSQPGTIYAIAVTYASSGPYYRALLAVYRSTSGGAAGSWVTRTSSQDPSRLNTAILSIDSAYNFGTAFCLAAASSVDFTGQAGYNLAVAVDPLDPNRVWAAGVGLFRSDDGGANWGYAFYGAHPDQHGLVFDPGYDGVTNQTLYNINDGGIYKTTQARGKTATCASPAVGFSWSPLNNGYTTTQFYHGVAYPGGAEFFGGTQDNGTLLGSSATGPWGSIYGGDGGVSRLDPLNANTVYVEYVLGAFAKSTDGGFTFNNAVTGITEDSNNFPFIAWYLFDPNNSQRLYTGGRQLWRTEDGMGHWTAASAPTDLVNGSTDNIRSIAVSPFDANLVLFGTHYGNIFRNDRTLGADGSTVWNHTAPRAGNVAHLEFDPNQPNTVYATYTTFNSAPGDNHVYRSTDGGATWTGIDGAGASGLPDVPVETILVDPADSTHLYLGADTGIFASFDGGNTWTHDDNPFANVIVTTLTIDSHQGARYLYAFTYGRGLWRVPLAGSGATPTCTYAISPSTVAADPTGGTYAINVATGANCGWSARPTASISAGSLHGFIQPPASGFGNGNVFLTIAPNASTAQRTATYLVQNQAVIVTQPGASSISAADEFAGASSAPSLPYAGFTSNSQRTQNAADPSHSCTGSADYQTAWTRFTAAQTGTVQVTLQGLRTSGQGAQVALTAYPLAGQSLGAELACATLTLDTAAPPQAIATVTFPVTAGAGYVLEFSALAPSTADSLYFGISMAPPAPVFDVSPPEAILQPGQSQLFQPVTANLGNTAVRWLVSPQFGVITPDGLYLAPTQVTAPTEVTLTAQSLGSPGLQSTATVTVQPAPPATLGAAAVANAASYQTGVVAPGEIVAVFGAGIGPAGLVTAQLNSQGRLASNLNGTQVLFDNIPAPLVYVTANQVSAIVPYEVAGRQTTQMVVVRNQQATQALTLAVTAVAPALFTANATGSGPAAVVNQDTSLNGPGSGAPAGSIVSLYGTGEGQTSPGGVNGRVANSLLPAPVAAVSVKIGGVDAPVTYAGAAAQAVAGLLQVNVRIPALAPGTYPVVLSIGGQSSRADVTLTVR